MNKILIVIKREYFTRVRSKAFIIGTILSPLFLVGLMVLPSLLAMKSGGERHITVLDQSGDTQLFNGIKQRLEHSEPASDDKKDFGNTKFTLVRVVVTPDQQVDELAKNYNALVTKDSDQAYLILRKGILDDEPDGRPEYYAKNPGDIVVGNVQRAISDEIRDRRLSQAKLSKEQIVKYTKEINLVKKNPSGEEEKGV